MASHAQARPRATSQPLDETSAFGRAELIQTPSREILESFFLTRGAASILTELHREPAPNYRELWREFWIVAPPGGGKTHFLNYLLALEGGAGLREAGPARKLVIAWTLGRDPSRLIPELIQAVANHLASGGRRRITFDQMSEEVALRVALEQAKRQGVHTLTLLLDLADADADAAARVATALRQIRAACTLDATIVAAARQAPDQTGALYEIAPAADEELQAALHRATITLRSARTIRPDGPDGNPITPEAAAALEVIAPADYRVTALTQITYEALAGRENSCGLIAPARLLTLPAVARLREQRLGEHGAAAIDAARAAAQTLPSGEKRVADELIELLVLGAMAQPARALTLEHLARDLVTKTEIGEIARILERLGILSGGIVTVSNRPRAAQLNLAAARLPAIVAFNRALPLARAFAPELVPVTHEAELEAALDRLRTAMLDAVERAAQRGETLVQLARNFGAALDPEQTAAISSYIALAAKGPAILIAEPADPDASRTIATYAQLAPLAAAAPMLAAMRDYLLMLLDADQIRDDPTRDPTLDKFEAEAKFLLVDVEAAVRSRSGAVLEALESRFERFKWTYAPFYRKAHQRWVAELNELVTVVDDATRQLAALTRLASIPALELHVEPDLPLYFAALAEKVRACDQGDRIAPELTPRCPSCGFTLGAESPRPQLLELTARIQRHLDAGFLKLSEAAISRLILEHQNDRSVEGLLKIIDAAQASALADVLDDRLTVYLKRLLEQDSPPAQAPGGLRHTQRSKRPARRAPRPPSGSRA